MEYSYLNTLPVMTCKGWIFNHQPLCQGASAYRLLWTLSGQSAKHPFTGLNTAYPSPKNCGQRYSFYLQYNKILWKHIYLPYKTTPYIHHYQLLRILKINKDDAGKKPSVRHRRVGVFSCPSVQLMANWRGQELVTRTPGTSTGHTALGPVQWTTLPWN